MSARRVEFRLGMPSVNSWNGRWSGEERNYLIVRSISQADVDRLGIAEGEPRRWTYSFGDGWVASVTGRLMKPGERAKKSDGFCGYNWMVDNIVRWGTPQCRCEWVPDPSWAPGEEWQRCIYCSTRMRVEAQVQS